MARGGAPVAVVAFERMDAPARAASAGSSRAPCAQRLTESGRVRVATGDRRWKSFCPAHSAGVAAARGRVQPAARGTRQFFSYANWMPAVPPVSMNRFMNAGTVSLRAQSR